MCGFAGISYSPDQSLDGSALHQALVALHHRGPDDSGGFEDPVQGIGLIHARLSIQDLSPLGHQPMTNWIIIAYSRLNRIKDL